MTSQVLLSSVVIGSLITGVCSLIISISTNKKVVSIENIKFKNDIQMDRYKELKKYNEIVRQLPKVDYTLRDKKGNHSQELQRIVVEKHTNRFYEIKDIYENIEPLIDVIYLKEIDRISIEEDEMSKRMITNIYTNKLDNKGNELKDLMMIRNQFEDELKSVLKKQIATIIKENKYK